MERLNSEGIPLQDLAATLRDRPKVITARRIDRCLLCRRPRVNEAGLCDSCYSVLPDAEAAIAHRWMRGDGP